MKLKRIDKYGCRGQIPVDMSEDFYNNGNEYCRYLITDYRASLLKKKSYISLLSVNVSYLTSDIIFL